MSFLNQLSSAEKIVAVFGAAGLAYTTFSAGLIQNKLTSQRGQIEQVATVQQAEIARRKDVREASKEELALTETIFKHFVDAITDKSTTSLERVDRLSGVLVLTYAIPDPRQQEGLAKAISQAMQRIQSPELASRTKEGTFDAEELVASASAAQRTLVEPPLQPVTSVDGNVRWSNYDFDVFWCEDVPDSLMLQERAAEILTFRSLDPNASGRWRPRPLPKLVNDRPSYGVKGYQVRYSSPDELVLAEAVKSQIQGKFPGADVKLVATTQNTPWYLSVFVCP